MSVTFYRFKNRGQDKRVYVSKKKGKLVVYEPIGHGRVKRLGEIPKNYVTEVKKLLEQKCKATKRSV